RWITSALGVLAAGAWLIPLNTRFKGVEAAFVLRKTEANALLCVNGFLGADPAGMLHDVDPKLPALQNVVVLDGPVGDACSSWDDLLAAGASVNEADVRARIDGIGAEDGSDIIFTSGTTGHPKGVMLRHGDSMRAFESYNEGFRLTEGDRLLVVLPFFHCFGYKAGWMLALMVGATTVPVPVFDPA